MADSRRPDRTRRRGVEPAGVRPGTGGRTGATAVAAPTVPVVAAESDDDDTVPVSRPLLLAAPAAAGYAAGVGLAVVGAVVLLVWALTPHGESSLEAALRTAGIAWCAMNRVPIVVGDGAIGVLPWLLLSLPLGLLYHGGRWAARAVRVTGISDAVLLVSALAVSYAAVAAVVAAWASSSVAAVVPGHAFLGAALVAVVGGGWGIVRAAGLGPRLRATIPSSTRPALRGGVAATATLIGGAAVVAAVAAALRVPDAATVARALGPGPAGLVVLGLLGAAYAPVAVSWALSYLVGVGFAVGDGTAVTPFTSRLGDLPSLPWLSALPDTVPRGAPFLLAVPVLAGAVGGVVLLRSLPGRSAPLVVGDVVTIAALAGFAAGVLAWLSTGGLGPGRLAVAGPSPLAVAGATAALVLVGTAISVTGETAWTHVKRRSRTA